AQVGVSGLRKVQYLVSAGASAADDADPYFERGDWRDAEILPPPDEWGLGQQPDGALGFDGATPHAWPLRYTVVDLTASLSGLAPGSYTLRCRSVDQNGIAQPMPRPFAKSGRAEIQSVELNVTAT